MIKIIVSNSRKKLYIYDFNDYFYFIDKKLYDRSYGIDLNKFSSNDLVDVRMDISIGYIGGYCKKYAKYSKDEFFILLKDWIYSCVEAKQKLSLFSYKPYDYCVFVSEIRMWVISPFSHCCDFSIQLKNIKELLV